MDGHFLHATWSFSTSGTAAKARHLRDRPAVSVAHVDGEELAVFSHGKVERMQPADPDWDETLGHWIAHYGSSPLEWGEDICLYRYRPHWMVAYVARPVRPARDARHRQLTAGQSLACTSVNADSTRLSGLSSPQRCDSSTSRSGSRGPAGSSSSYAAAARRAATATTFGATAR